MEGLYDVIKQYDPMDANGLPHHKTTEHTFFQTHIEYLLKLTIQLELDMEQQTGSKQEKEYVKAVYCHPTYLTYMQNTS